MAIAKIEEEGIVFIDEIDKVAIPEVRKLVYQLFSPLPRMLKINPLFD